MALPFQLRIAPHDPSTSPVSSRQWQLSIMACCRDPPGSSPWTKCEVVLHLIGLGCLIMVAVSLAQLESIISQEGRHASCCLPSACSYSFTSVQQASQSLNILEGGICGPISRADARAMECENELFGGHNSLVSTCIVDRRRTDLKLESITQSELEIEMRDICSQGLSTGSWLIVYPIMVAVWTGFAILAQALRICLFIPAFWWLLTILFGGLTLGGIGFLTELRSEKGYQEYYQDYQEYGRHVTLGCHGQMNSVNVIHLQWLEGADAMSSFDAWIMVLIFSTLGAMIFPAVNIWWLCKVRGRREGTSRKVVHVEPSAKPRRLETLGTFEVKDECLTNQTNEPKEPSFFPYSA